MTLKFKLFYFPTFVLPAAYSKQVSGSLSNFCENQSSALTVGGLQERSKKAEIRITRDKNYNVVNIF